MQLYQNLLTEQELTVINTTLRGHHWGFYYTSTDPSKPIWNFDKKMGEPLARVIASKLEGYQLLDWHINGQTKLMDASMHNDAHGGCTHAFIFFPQKWEYVWGGRLHLFPEKMSPIIITPEQNTGLLFESSIPHYAEGVHYNASFLRTTIGLKLRKTA